jgi:hypothetical protein
MKPIPKLNAAPGAVWPLPNEDTVKLKQIAAMAAALLVLGNGAANAGQTINEAGALACVNDKWDEKETDKEHKLVRLRWPMHRYPRRPRCTEEYRRVRRKVRVHA